MSMQLDIDDKIREAMHRIEELYHETNGQCYVSFSGGKDSTVVLAIIKMCVDLCTIKPIKAVFCDTGIELGATRDFVKWCKENWYPNIEIIRPQKSFKWVLDNRGKPMKSKMKSELLGRYQRTKNQSTKSFNYLMGVSESGETYAKTKLADKDLHIIHNEFPIKVANDCCKYLKKEPFKQYQKENEIKGYILGFRMSEGGARELGALKRIKDGGKLCTTTKGNYIVKMPIIDWTDDDIEEFIQKYNIPLSKAYTDYGLKRTGCMGCPFSLDIENNLKVLWEHEPNRYKASMFFLKDVYIAQNVRLPFDEEYEHEREEKWSNDYIRMRNEMLLKYRPKSRLIEHEEQLKLKL